MVHLYKGLLAVTRLCSCSTDTLTPLVFLNKEELSHKPAPASKASLGQLTLSALGAENRHRNKAPGLWSLQAQTCKVAGISQSRDMSKLPELAWAI